jgi:hypothetical protein|tara:strand:+ start:4509 stop:4748 length:240 start_codon:yes stop_codon:yes gene_type:complete
MKKNKKVPQLFHESCPYCGIGIQIHRLIGEAYGIISGIASWHGDIPDDIREICRDAYNKYKSFYASITFDNDKIPEEKK